ncbi:MAG: rRNA pseudouridine synthase [Francisellaceae bacterium]|jgi:23S rRNA pseudouridine2605 synthase|nr:rRNA pseudouridine synthase [Francisellaceae bacterium]MBT6206812.1 rRNA pseudouridine synthase [Francisellaceae bacterium]MBT6539702.1 rRNA pseudouridine synthase [Francisellaceae bacterium]
MINSDRIQKVLAKNGFGSRRGIESLIKEGRISVNNASATLGMQICATDVIAIDNTLIEISWEATNTQVLVFHKPPGVICSTNSQGHKQTVFDYLPVLTQGKWILVGRLDVDTSGLLLITNSGDLAHKLMHPKSNLPRHYTVTVQDHPKPTDLLQAKEGISDQGELLRFTSITKVSTTKNSSSFDVCLHQGKNREIRRIWEWLGYKVIELHRYQYGPTSIPSSLTSGEYYFCSSDEIKELEDA